MSNLLFPAGEMLLLLAALVGLGALVGIGEGLRVLGVSVRTTRRLVHGGVALFVATTPQVFTEPLPVYLLAGLFMVLNAVARSQKWWAGIHEARPESWGTVAMPLAVLPALASTWSTGADRIFVFQGAFLVLAVADPLAGRIGQAFGREGPLSGTTWIGSSTFCGIAFLLIGGVLIGGEKWVLGRVVGSAAITALIATAIEAVCDRGWDNLFVVLGVILVLIPLHEDPSSALPLTFGSIVGIGVCGVAYWSQALTAPGAVGAGLFAASLVGLGGWAWAVPGFAFFVLSSTLSRLPEASAPAPEAILEDDAERSLRQVLANGAVAWGLLGVAIVLPPGSEGVRALCYAGFLGALAAAAADTWATELGIRFGAAPRSLRTLRPVPPGTSGAVSVTGTGAAILGAASVAGAAVLVTGPVGMQALQEVGGVIGAGLIGMVMDSIVGATAEAHYWDPETERYAERPVHNASPTRGWAGIDNEIVNVLGTLTGAAAAIAITGGL